MSNVGILGAGLGMLADKSDRIETLLQTIAGICETTDIAGSFIEQTVPDAAIAMTVSHIDFCGTSSIKAFNRSIYFSGQQLLALGIISALWCDPVIVVKHPTDAFHICHDINPQKDRLPKAGKWAARAFSAWTAHLSSIQIFIFTLAGLLAGLPGVQLDLGFGNNLVYTGSLEFIEIFRIDLVQIGHADIELGIIFLGHSLDLGDF